MSANFFSHGLYSSSQDDLPQIPPIYSSPKMFDELLKVSCPCPVFQKLLKESVYSDLAVSFAKRELPLFQKLNEILGKQDIFYKQPICCLSHCVHRRINHSFKAQLNTA